METFIYDKEIGKLTKKIGMMMNSIEKRIVGLFLQEPFKKHTVYAVAKKLETYISQVQTGIKNLERQEILAVNKIGVKTSLCSINFSTAHTDILSIASFELKKKTLESNAKLAVITNEIETKLQQELFVMILFGSQSKGTAKQHSDIDLCFLCEQPEIFQKKLEIVLSTFTYNIHYVVFTTKQFYDMIKLKESVGREIMNHGIVLRGHEFYYGLVKQYDKEHGYSQIL